MGPSLGSTSDEGDVFRLGGVGVAHDDVGTLLPFLIYFACGFLMTRRRYLMLPRTGRPMELERLNPLDSILRDRFLPESPRGTIYLTVAGSTPTHRRA